MNEKQEILELYKVMVETITANEQRRQQASALYLSLIAAGITALGAIKGLDPIYIALPSCLVALIWFRTIVYFRRLASAKFNVISKMEKNFSIHPFELEWKIFKKGSEKGWRKLFSHGLTELEMIVPGLLTFISGIYVFYRACIFAFSGS